MARRQCNELVSPRTKEKRLAGNQKSARPLFEKRSEGQLDLALIARIQNEQVNIEIMCSDPRSFRLRVNQKIVGIDQHTDFLTIGYQFMQQLERLSNQFNVNDRHACQIDA